MTVRAVRHYHQRVLLAEPARDSSGYRRYDADAVVDLIRIKTPGSRARVELPPQVHVQFDAGFALEMLSLIHIFRAGWPVGEWPSSAPA